LHLGSNPVSPALDISQQQPLGNYKRSSKENTCPIDHHNQLNLGHGIGARKGSHTPSISNLSKTCPRNSQRDHSQRNTYGGWSRRQSGGSSWTKTVHHRSTAANSMRFDAHAGRSSAFSRVQATPIIRRESMDGEVWNSSCEADAAAGEPPAGVSCGPADVRI
jgi:hypothetical protein